MDFLDFVSESLLIILKKRDFTSVFFTVRKERQEKVDENSLAGGITVFRSVHAIVDKAVDSGSGNVHSGV